MPIEDIEETDTIASMTGIESNKQFNGIIPKDDEIIQVNTITGGARLVSDRKVELTHSLCYELLEMAEFIGERPLRDSHVTVLATAMKRGTFHPEWVRLITCTDLSSGIKYRANGQHTCWSRLVMPEDWTCKVGLMHYEADSMADLRQLYASIDRIAPRTKANVVSSYLTGTDQFQGVNSKLLRLLAEGLSFWLWDQPSKRSRHDGDTIAFLMQNDYAALTNRISDFMLTDISRSCQTIMKRAPVAAAMFETFNKAPQKAIEFWEPVRSGVGMTDVGDPRLRLRNALSETSLLSRASMVTRVQRVVPEEMYRWCIHAWNAWRKGEKLNKLRATLVNNGKQVKRPSAR